MDNPEVCQCNNCVKWREIVKNICIKRGLDYNKVTRKDKTELFNIFIYNSEEQAENIWDIGKSKFKYAKVNE